MIVMLTFLEYKKCKTVQHLSIHFAVAGDRLQGVLIPNNLPGEYT